MAQEKLRVKIEGDASSYKKAINQAKTSTAKLSGAQKTSAKATNRQGQTFTQLAYALDDAQYGFRGVQNNLQAVAVSAGIGGPIVLGITAMLIGIQQLITHWDEFGDIASKALKAINDEISGGQGTVAKMMLFQNILKTSAKGSDEYKYALKRLKDNGFDPLNQSIEKFIELQKQKAILEAYEKVGSDRISTYLKKIFEAQEDLNEAREKFNKAKNAGPAVQGASPLNPGQFGGRDGAFVNLTKAEKDLAKLETDLSDFLTKIGVDMKTRFPDGILGKLITSSGSGRQKIESPLGFDLINSTIEQGKEWQKYAKKIVEAFADAWNIAVDGAVLKVPGVDEIDAGLKATRDKLGHNVTTLQSNVKDAGAALQASAASAFSGLGVAIGEALAGDGNFGEKFLKTLGTFMVQFGSALIALGIAEAAWLANLEPTTKIVAGAALVIAGAAISSAYKEKPGGNSGSSSYGTSGSAYSSPAPQIVQGSNGNNFTLGQVRFRGQDMITTIEAGQRIRSNKT